jgi:hypothetical protein
VLGGEKLAAVKIKLPEDLYSKNEPIEEICVDTLLYLTIPYIHGYLLDGLDSVQFYEDYCDECEYFKIVNKRLISIRKSVFNRFDREDKIFLLRMKKDFKDKPYLWNDKDWVIEMLRYLYAYSIDSMFYSHFELSLKKMRGSAGERSGEKKNIECYVVDARGKRENLLVSRNRPTMSLEELANKEIDRMENLNEMADKDIEEESSAEKSLEGLRNEDELRDSGLRGSGNTIGRG